MNNDRIYYSHDAEARAIRETAKLTMLCLALGASIGAALALLFAPSSGKNTRANVTRSVEESFNDGRKAVEPLVKRFEEEVSDLRNNVEKSVAHQK
jgi:gas vesicle protein